MCASAAKQLTATSDWFLYPGIKDTHLPPQATNFYRHKRLKKETAILLPQAIRPWNAAPATQKQQSPAALKNITCGSKKWTFLLPQAIGASYRHKRSTSHIYIYINRMIGYNMMWYDMVWYAMLFVYTHLVNKTNITHQICHVFAHASTLWYQIHNLILSPLFPGTVYNSSYW